MGTLPCVDFMGVIMEDLPTLVQEDVYDIPSLSDRALWSHVGWSGLQAACWVTRRINTMSFKCLNIMRGLNLIGKKDAQGECWQSSKE